MTAVMILECSYRPADPPAQLSLLWLALALAIGCFGALVAMVAGPAVGLAPAALAFGMVLGVLIQEVRERQCVNWA